MALTSGRETPDKLLHDPMIEKMVPWCLNGQAQPPFLCTPDALGDLVSGHLLSSGMISSLNQITKMEITPDGIHILVSGSAVPQRFISERLVSFSPLDSTLHVSLAALVKAADRLTSEESFYGTHRIMLQGPKGDMFKEDIGRHNAVDKVIGAAARQGWDFSQCSMGATGRISLEILLKAAIMGIAVLFTKKYASDLASEQAQRLGIAIAGKIQSAGPELSGAVWRIDPDISL